jgi:hypothetical protein
MKNSDEPPKLPDALELEFPDWNGMDDSTTRVSPDAAFRFCELYRMWFPELASRARINEREKCLVEFVL